MHLNSKIIISIWSKYDLNFKVRKINELKTQKEEIDGEIQNLRDEIMNIVVNMPEQKFENDCYQVSIIDAYDVFTVTKQQLFDALANSGISEEEKRRIFNSALTEKIYTGGVRIKIK